MKQLGTNKNSIQVLKDPFHASKITNIHLNYSRVMFEKYFSWTATVKFQNGNTKGSQDFEVTDIESDNAFEVITKQIQVFVDSLN